jgi:hypothetical protein
MGLRIRGEAYLDHPRCESAGEDLPVYSLTKKQECASGWQCLARTNYGIVLLMITFT